ncbi:MAG: SPFH domain-containing protein, partial [Pirellulales bacterium]
GTAATAAATAGTPFTGGMSFDDLAKVPVTKDAQAMLRDVANAAGYQVTEEGQVMHVTVPIGTLRKQVVVVDLRRRDKDGQQLITYTSTCGAARPEIAVKLLKYNTGLIHGAFAIQETEGGDMVVIQANEMAETADPLEISRRLAAIAWQADKVEEKLQGGDAF